MVTCAVSQCKNSSAKQSKKDGITFHRFPQDKDRRKRWEIAVNRDRRWKSTPSTSVCSEHFDAGDFYLTESGLRRLSGEAIPTINISPFEEQQPTLTELKPAGIKPDDSGEVIQLKYKVRRLEVIAANQKKRLSQMYQSKRRMRKKLERLKHIIKHLTLWKKRANKPESHIEES